MHNILAKKALFSVLFKYFVYDKLNVDRYAFKIRFGYKNKFKQKMI